MCKCLCILSITFFLHSFSVFGTDRVSIASGNWGTAGTWSPAGIPQAADNITIAAGHVITMNANGGNCLSLTVNGTANWTQARTTNVGVGGLVMNGGTIGGTRTGTLNVAGDFTTLGTNSIGRGNLNISGAATISTIVNITSTTGTKTFANLLVTGTFNNTVNANIIINGNFQNDGAFNICMGCGATNAGVTFGGAASNTITGSSTTDFNLITIDKGASSANVLDVQSLITMRTGGLTLTNGTFKLSSASSIIPFPADIEAAPYLIPATAELWCNGGTINSDPALTSSVVNNALAGNWTIAGSLRISAGTVTLGTAADQRLRAVGGSTQLNVEGGVFNVAGRISRAVAADDIAFTMSAGTINVPTVGSSDGTFPPINMDQAGSAFTMTGGTIIIQREGGTGAQNLGFLANAGTVGISGGVIQFGDASTPAGQTMQMNCMFSIANLTISSSNAICQLASPLTILQAVNINSGILDANNLNLTIGGSWTNSGTFTSGTGVVTFNGTGTQIITKSGGESFYDLTVNKPSGTVLLTNDAEVTNALIMTAGDVNPGSNILTLGTGVASIGTLTHSSGTITGCFRRWVNSTATPYLFPVGTVSDYRPGQITFGALTAGTLTFCFVSTDPGNNGLPLSESGTSIPNQYTEGYWNLSAADGLSSVNYDLDLTGNGFISYSVSTSTRILYRALASDPWSLNGSHASATGNTAMRTGISGLSAQFAFGKPTCSVYVAASISGNTGPCISTSENYNVDASSPANTYTWSISPAAAGSITGGQGTPTVAITWGATGQNAILQAVEINDCGDNNPTALTLAIALHPIATSTITGAISVSTNQTAVSYSVTNTPGYTYAWSFPGGGGAQVSGGTTNAITADWGATAGTYTVRVTTTRLCGAPDVQDLSVVVRTPFYSRANGNWSMASTWSSVACGGVAAGAVPGANDEVIICAAHTVTMNNNANICRKLTINGTATWTQARTTTVGAGGVVVNSTGNITGTGAGFLLSEGGFTGTGNGNISSSTVIVRLQTNPQNITSDGALNLLDITTTVTNTGTVTITNTLSGAGTLTQGSNSMLNVDGATFSLSNLNASASGNTVSYGATTNQTVRAGTYHHLTVSGTGTKSLGGATSVNGNVNISSATAILDVSTNNYALSVQGNWTNSGDFAERFGTVTLNGASAQTITATGGETFNNLSTSGSGTKVLGTSLTVNFDFTNSSSFNAGANNIDIRGNWDNSGSATLTNDVTFSNNSLILGSTTTFNNVIITGTLTGHSSSMNVAGNWTNNGTFNNNSGTVALTGDNQTIAGTSANTFNHLTLAGTGIKTLGAAITTNGNLTISSSLDVSASNYGLNVKGNWANNGIFIARNGTVTFDGSVAQSIGGTAVTDFYDITQNNTAGVSLAGSQNLFNTLTVSAGTFTSTGQNFTLKSTAVNTARIAALLAGSDFAGNIIIERYTGTGPTDWRFFSSAVSGATIADWADDFATSGFTGSTDPGNSFVSIYTYDETVPGTLDQGFVPATNVTNSISNGKGYWVYLGPNPFTYEVTGPPNKFAQSPAISFTSSGGASEDGWNLIANPYPCEIDWEDPNWTKTNLDDAVYIYNSTTGSFAAYVGGLGVNGGSRYIASQQAFWIKANAAGPAVTLREEIKAGTNPEYLKKFEINANGPIQNSIRLKVKGSGLEDETIIRFASGPSSGFDSQYDAKKMISTLNISSVIPGGDDLSINQRPALTAAVSIPIRITVPATGIYTIRRDSTLMLPMSSCVILEDKVTGSLIDFQANNSYSCTISDTTSSARFIIHFSPSITKLTKNVSCAGVSNGMAVAKGTGTGPWNYTWKNQSGDLLKSTSNSFQPDTLFNLSAGTYTVEVSGSSCGIAKDTFSVLTPSPLELIGHFTDVTCNGMSDGTAAVLIAGGALPYTYLWSNGASLPQTSNLPPQTYSVLVTDANNCTAVFAASVSSPVVADFGTNRDTAYISLNDSIAFNNSSSGSLY